MIARIRAAFARYKMYSTTLAELNALTDRELADIGLSRTQVREVALEAARA